MSYQQVTLSELQIQLASRVENKPWWSSAESVAALNEGLRIWNAATGRWLTKVYVPLVPNDPWVPLPGAIAQPVRVLYNAIPLEKASQADLDYSIPNWRGATTATPGHPNRPVYWAPVSLTLLVIYPAFADFPSTLEVAGVHQTPLLVNAGDFVDLGEEELDLLLGYAQHVLAFKVGGPRFVLTYPKWLAFLKAAAAENRQLAATAFYRRLLGLDLQRWQRRQERPVTTPVDGTVDAGQQFAGDANG